MKKLLLIALGAFIITPSYSQEIKKIKVKPRPKAFWYSQLPTNTSTGEIGTYSLTFINAFGSKVDTKKVLSTNATGRPAAGSFTSKCKLVSNNADFKVEITAINEDLIVGESISKTVTVDEKKVTYWNQEVILSASYNLKITAINNGEEKIVLDTTISNSYTKIYPKDVYQNHKGYTSERALSEKWSRFKQSANYGTFTEKMDHAQRHTFLVNKAKITVGSHIDFVLRKCLLPWGQFKTKDERFAFQDSINEAFTAGLDSMQSIKKENKINNNWHYIKAYVKFKEALSICEKVYEQKLWENVKKEDEAKELRATLEANLFTLYMVTSDYENANKFKKMSLSHNIRGMYGIALKENLRKIDPVFQREVKYHDFFKVMFKYEI
jgi:hypothetical protein